MAETFKWRIAQGLEIRWWKRYLRGKDVEAYLDWKRNYWKRFLDPLGDDLLLDEGAAILDAGCGPAGVFVILDGFDVTAVDPLLDRYAAELPHFDPAKHPGVRFVTDTIERFEGNGKFRTIFCLNAINHVRELDTALDNLFHLLAEDGKLVLSVDCHRYGLLKKLFRLFPGDALHPHQHDLADYRKMIGARGGKVIREVLSRPGHIFDYHVLVVEKAGIDVSG
jgi:2-polyprenyl-6-hydroxyphenyl methylase/3-demethylubiquinone-9 3-methyltransferase